MPISAMLIFALPSNAAATSRIVETLIGAAAGLIAGLLFAPLRVQPAKEAVGDLSRQMADLLSQMADGLAEAPDPRRAAEWLDRTRALRGEIERVDDALAQAEESVRLNPRRLTAGNPAAGLRDGLDTLERAATDIRMLTRSVADSARIDSEHDAGQGGRDPGPAGRHAERAVRRGPGLRPAARGRSGRSGLLRVRGRADRRGAGRPPRGGPAAAGPARRPALHQSGRTAGGMAAARRDPGPRGPAALRARVRPAAGLGPGQAAPAGAAGPAPERAAPGGAAPGRTASGSGHRAAAAAEPDPAARPGQADRVPGHGPGGPGDGRVSRGGRPRRCDRPGRAGTPRSSPGGTPGTHAGRAAPRHRPPPRPRAPRPPRRGRGP